MKKESKYIRFTTKTRIVDVKKETKDGVMSVPTDVYPYRRRQVFIYNVYSIKTQEGWIILNCPDKFFNRPPQIGMFISANRHKKIFEITGRNGR